MSTTNDWPYNNPDFEAPGPDPWDALNDSPSPDTGPLEIPWADATVDASEAPEPDAIDVEGTSTPDAIEHEKTASGRERLRQGLAGRHARGIEWVRPSDLFTRLGGSASGRGIDYTAELSRRLRSHVADNLHDVGARARHLPGLAAFGRRGHSPQAPARSGVGME